MSKTMMMRNDFIDNVFGAIPEDCPNRVSVVGLFVRIAYKCSEQEGVLTLPGKEAPETEVADLLGMDVTSAKDALDVLTRASLLRRTDAGYEIPEREDLVFAEE